MALTGKQYEKCVVRVSPLRMTHSSAGMVAFLKEAKAQYTDRSQIAEDVLWKAFCKQNTGDKKSSKQYNQLTKALFTHTYEKMFQRKLLVDDAIADLGSDIQVNAIKEHASSQSTPRRTTRRILSDMNQEMIRNNDESNPQRRRANIETTKSIEMSQSKGSGIVSKYSRKKTKNVSHPILSLESNNLLEFNSSFDEMQPSVRVAKVNSNAARKREQEDSLLKPVRRLRPKTKAFLDSSNKSISTTEKHTTPKKAEQTDVHDKKPPARRTTRRFQQLSSSDEMQNESKREIRSDARKGGPKVRQKKITTRLSTRRNPQNIVKTGIEAPESNTIETASESDSGEDSGKNFKQTRSKKADVASRMTTRRSGNLAAASKDRSSKGSHPKIAAGKDVNKSGRKEKCSSWAGPDRKNVEEPVASPITKVTRKTSNDMTSSKMLLSTRSDSNSDREDCEQHSGKPGLNRKKHEKKQKVYAKISTESDDESIPKNESEYSSDNIRSSRKELRKTYPMRSTRTDSRRYCHTDEESPAKQTTLEKLKISRNKIASRKFEVTSEIEKQNQIHRLQIHKDVSTEKDDDGDVPNLCQSTSEISKLKRDLSKKKKRIYRSKQSVIRKSHKKAPVEEYKEYLSTSSSEESENDSEFDISEYQRNDLGTTKSSTDIDSSESDAEGDDKNLRTRQLRSHKVPKMNCNLRKRPGKELPIDKPEPSTKYGRMSRKVPRRSDHGNSQNLLESSEEMLTDSEDNTIQLKPAPKSPARQIKSSEKAGNQNRYRTRKVIKDSGDEVEDEQRVVMPKDHSKRSRKSKSFTKQIANSESESRSDVNKVRRTSRPVLYTESESSECDDSKNYSLRNKQGQRSEPAVHSPVRQQTLRKSPKIDLSESEEEVMDSKGGADVLETATVEKRKVRVRKYSKPGKLPDTSSSSDDEILDMHHAIRLKRIVTGKESATLGLDDEKRKYSLQKKKVRKNEVNESCNDNISSSRISRKCRRRNEPAVESESSEEIISDNESDLSGFLTVTSPKSKTHVNKSSKIGNSIRKVVNEDEFPANNDETGDLQVAVSKYTTKRLRNSKSTGTQITSTESESDDENVRKDHGQRKTATSKKLKTMELSNEEKKSSRILREASKRKYHVAKTQPVESSEETVMDSENEIKRFKTTDTIPKRKRLANKDSKFGEPSVKVAVKTKPGNFSSSSASDQVASKYADARHCKRRSYKIKITSSESEGEDIRQINRTGHATARKEPKTTGNKYSLRMKEETKSRVDDSSASTRILRTSVRSYYGMEGQSSESSEEMIESEDGDQLKASRPTARKKPKATEYDDGTKKKHSLKRKEETKSDVDDSSATTWILRTSVRSYHGMEGHSSEAMIESGDDDQLKASRPTARKKPKATEYGDGRKKSSLKRKEEMKSGVDNSSASTRILRTSVRSYHGMEGQSSESSEEMIESEDDNELKMASRPTAKKEPKAIEYGDGRKNKSTLRRKEEMKSGVDNSSASTRNLRMSARSYHGMEGHSSESSEEMTDSEEDANKLKSMATASNQKRHPNKYLNYVKPKNISYDVENCIKSCHPTDGIENSSPIMNLKFPKVCITRIQLNGNCKPPDCDGNIAIPPKELKDSEQDKSTMILVQQEVGDKMKSSLSNSSDEDLSGSESAKSKLHSGHKDLETEKTVGHHEPCASENDDPPNDSPALKHHLVSPPDIVYDSQNELISSPKNGKSSQNDSPSEDSVSKKNMIPEKSPNLPRRKQILPLDSDDDSETGNKQQKPGTTKQAAIKTFCLRSTMKRRGITSAETHMDDYDDTDVASGNDAADKPIEIHAGPSVKPSRKITSSKVASSKRRVGIKDALKELKLLSSDEPHSRRRPVRRKRKAIIYDSDTSQEESEAIPKLIPIAADVQSAINVEATEVLHSGQSKPISSAIPSISSEPFLPNLTDDEEQCPQASAPDSDTESIGAICRFLNVNEPPVSPPMPPTKAIAKDQVTVTDDSLPCGQLAEHLSSVIRSEIVEKNDVIKEVDVTDGSKLDGTDDVDTEKSEAIDAAQTCDIEDDSDEDKMLDEESIAKTPQDSCLHSAKVVLHKKVDDTLTSPQRKKVQGIEESDSSTDTDIFPLESHLRSLEFSDTGNCSTGILPKLVEDIPVVGSDTVSETVEQDYVYHVSNLNVCEEICESGDGIKGEQEQASSSVGDLFEQDDSWDIGSEYSIDHNAGESSSTQLCRESESKPKHSKVLGDSSGASTSRISPSGSVKDVPHDEERELLRFKTLKRYIKEAGLHMSFKSLFHEDDTTREKSKKLVKVLHDNGLTGQFTLLKCRAIKEQRERKNTGESDKADQDAVSTLGTCIAHRIYSSSGIFRTSPNKKPASN